MKPTKAQLKQARDSVAYLVKTKKLTTADAIASLRADTTKGFSWLTTDVWKNNVWKNAPKSYKTSVSKMVNANAATLAAGKKESAYTMVKSLLTSAGLGDLSTWFDNIIKQKPGIIQTPAVLVEELRNQNAYKARFSGLVALREQAKNGTYQFQLPDEGQYLEMEKKYIDALGPAASLYTKTTVDPTTGQVMAAGDAGKSSLNATIGKLIAQNISAVEIANRVDQAKQWASNTDQATKAALKQYYDIDESELIGYALDPTTATEVFNRRAASITAGSQAFANNVALNVNESEKLIKDVISTGAYGTGPEAATAAGAQVAKATQEVAAGQETIAKLADTSGTNVSTLEQLGAATGTNAQAQEKIKSLKSLERARFSGSSAGDNLLSSNVSGLY